MRAACFSLGSNQTDSTCSVQGGAGDCSWLMCWCKSSLFFRLCSVGAAFQEYKGRQRCNYQRLFLSPKIEILQNCERGSHTSRGLLLIQLFIYGIVYKSSWSSRRLMLTVSPLLLCCLDGWHLSFNQCKAVCRMLHHLMIWAPVCSAADPIALFDSTMQVEMWMVNPVR